MASSPSWHPVTSIALNLNEIAIRRPIKINEIECLIIPSSLHDTPILIYNSNNDTYDELTTYPSDFYDGYFAVSFDEIHQILYFFNKPNYLETYNLITKRWKEQTLILPQDWSGSFLLSSSRSIIAENKFNIITKNKILIYDINTKQISQIKHYTNNYRNFSMFYYRSKQEIWVLGCKKNNGDNITSQDVMKYDIKSTKSQDIEWKLPISIYYAAEILTTDEKYLILFGGVFGENTMDKIDDIYIVDIMNNLCYKSKIKCPIKAMRLNAYLMVDGDRNELLIEGFVRNCWNDEQFGDMRYLSDDVILVIVSYFSADFVHLFDKSDGKHWKIPISQVLKDMVQC